MKQTYTQDQQDLLNDVWNLLITLENASFHYGERLRSAAERIRAEVSRLQAESHPQGDERPSGSGGSSDPYMPDVH